MSAQYIQIPSYPLHRHSDGSILQKCEPRNPDKLNSYDTAANTHLKWISAHVPQGYSDLLCAKTLAKSYAGMMA